MTRRGALALLPAALLLACSPSPPPELPPAKRVVLVTIDTLRADRIGAYGDAEAETPTLDTLAAEGVRFDQAIAPTPITRPSHASILTGLEPPEHGVRGNSVFSLTDDVPVVTERFAEAGYGTAAFVAAFVLHSRFGLARGFDVYDDDTAGRRSSAAAFAYAERRADEVVDSALAWVREAPDSFFLWVHLYDPHADYAPPEPFATRHANDLYAGEIAFADAQVGRLLAGIQRRFGLDDLAVVVTSDHGEALGEHGEISHAFTLYDATQRVPLILFAPGRLPARNIRSQVRLADVAPTLLELAGLEPLPGISGQSLLPLMSEEETERIAYVEALEPQIALGWSPVLGVRTNRFKYLRAPRPELYDLVRDPRELENIASTHPEEVARLDAEVARIADAGRVSSGSTELSAADRARLESLGYLMPPEDEIQASAIGVVGGPDPKDRLPEANAMQRAAASVRAGRGDLALAQLDAIEEPGRFVLITRAWAARSEGRFDLVLEAGDALLELEPDGPVPHLLRGGGLYGLGRVEEAKAAFETALKLAPESAEVLVSLGKIADHEGREEAALDYFERADRHQDAPAEARLEIALLHLRAGRHREAQETIASLSPAFALRPRTQIQLAFADHVAGRSQRAVERLQRMLNRNPDEREGWATLAALLQGLGRPEEAVAALRRAHALSPSEPAHQNDLAWNLAIIGEDLELALRLARRAAATLGRSPMALDTLATVHLVRGEAEAALAVADEALPGAGPDLAAHLHYLRAAALSQLGRPGEARRALAALRRTGKPLGAPFDERARELAKALGVAAPTS